MARGHLGAIDRELAATGERGLRANCVDCHQIIDRQGHEASCAARTEVAIPSYPVNAVGTDPARRSTSPPGEITLGQRTQPLGAWVKLVTDKVVGQYTADPENAARTELINCGAGNDFQANEEYRARPLNGIWATAPYLHNGSVPDMAELLKPRRRAPGQASTSAAGSSTPSASASTASQGRGAFKYDTRMPGNSNAGHDHGSGLGEPDRRALIEYLKTL